MGRGEKREKGEVQSVGEEETGGWKRKVGGETPVYGLTGVLQRRCTRRISKRPDSS